MNKEHADSAEARYQDIDKRYEAEGISIRWQPQYCIHAGECFRGSPAVFDPKRRPWVIADASTADEIAQTVLRCPTGALHFTRKDDGAQEDIGEVTISPQKNGPLYVRGHVKIQARDGTVIREDTRIALCRCGHSENKPFCDNSHVVTGFRT